MANDDGTWTFQWRGDQIVTTKWYTIRQAAKITGYSVRTIRQFVYDGKIYAEKHGSRWYLHSSDVERCIRGKRDA